jgi:hypothetical protein
MGSEQVRAFNEASRASGFQEALIWEIDMTINRTAMIDYVDARIAQTSNPKHVEQLKVLRAHIVGEVSEDVDALLATVSPLRQQYRMWGAPEDLQPASREAIRAFYFQRQALGQLYFQFDIDRLTVADDIIIITDGVMTSFIPGAFVAGTGQQTSQPEAVHELKMRMLISWPFDETSLLIGEETYSAVIAVRPLADSEIPRTSPLPWSADVRVLDPADIIGAAAARHGDRTALICRDRTLTYAELDAAVSRVAAGLGLRGVWPGERVTLFSENRWEWVAAYLGILRAGCVVNPVNAMLTAPELAVLVEDCGSAALLASGTCTERIGAVLPTGVRLRVSFDDALAGVVRLADLLSDGPADWDPSSARPRDLCSISYTSGTTGHPKGAMQAREALLLNWAYAAAMHARSAADVVLTALPLPHVYGNCAVNSALLTGATVVLEPSFDAKRMLGLVAEYGVTMMEGVPAMYSMMLDALAMTAADFTTVTRCTVGGQTISDAVVEAWEKAAGAPLLELWGMTELSGLATTQRSGHACPQPSACPR